MAKLRRLLRDQLECPLAGAGQQHDQQGDQRAHGQDDRALLIGAERLRGLATPHDHGPVAIDRQAGAPAQRTGRCAAPDLSRQHGPRSGVRVIQLHGQARVITHSGPDHRGDVKRADHPSGHRRPPLRHRAHGRAMGIDGGLEEHRAYPRQVYRHRHTFTAVGRAREQRSLARTQRRAGLAPVLLDQLRRERGQRDQLATARQQAIALLPAALHRHQPPAQQRPERRIRVPARLKCG